MPHPSVIVKINGNEAYGWTHATVTASLERIPRTFELGVILPLLQTMGDVLAFPLEVWLDHGDGNRDKVLTGYVDGVQNSLQEASHEILINGRGICSDLVDSSTELNSSADLTVGQSGEVTGMTARQVASKICGYYDIPLVVLNKNADIPYNYQVPVTTGDSAYSAIEYIARATLCLLYENENGALVLGAAGSEPASQTEINKFNCIRSAVHVDLAQLYKFYEIWVTAPVKVTQELLKGNAPPGTATDPAFNDSKTAANGKPRYRKFRKVESFIPDPLIYGTQSPQQVYANYICNRLNGRAQQITVTVQGWTDAQGKLWRPNQSVNIKLPYQLSAPVAWLVADCTYNISIEEGTTTTLTFMPSTAFSVEPLSGQAADVRKLIEQANGLPQNATT